ncbi:MAG: FAD-dependent oxidoreductase [Solirubrobacterales bacterium]|nr:FAD-dependent oxidoreductase [Solirubrobacterales bacterium]
MRTVAVVGSGAAGLSAALAAARAGARVTVYERAAVIGGSTALSGGLAWLPAHERCDGDSPEAALRYLRALALGDVDDHLLEVFAREAGPTAARLEEATALRLQPVPYADYHAEFDGGREQGGRSLEPAPFDPAPGVATQIREAPNITGPITYAELAGGEIDRDELARRRERGTLTLGRALLAALLEACLDVGVEVRTGARITTRPPADAVILASGGFERSPQLTRSFLRGPMLAPVGAPGMEGDGLRIAMAAGAALGSMSEAWWCPAISIPGEEIEAHPMHRLILTERARPGSVIVDGGGRRFVDEAQNYNDLGRSLHDFDAAGFRFSRVPAWLVFDARNRRRYRLGPLGRRDPDPDWLARADRLGELGAAIGVPAGALETTVERFNSTARDGHDPDFGRGSYPYDRFIGGLGALEEPPFYALRILPGCLGTKGGPRTDSWGRVLSITSGEPVPGLYAAGNAAASPFGLAYPGAGGTLGPALVFGLRAGDAAAADG